MISANGYTLDLTRGVLTREGSALKVRLPSKPRGFLAVHMRNAGRVVSIREVDEAVYGGDARDTSVYRVMANRIRRSMERLGGSSDDLRTFWGQGYLFVGERVATVTITMTEEQRAALNVVLASAEVLTPDAVKTVREAMNASA